ncbi:MAG TPA: CmcJ/NvfI family oxidoreductase [Burkholderiaceae bacterium]|nr:CmcJ/NvfI family oxidoreductase [Burkholderiaceae bacterium]
MASVLDAPHAGIGAPISVEAALNYTRKTGVRPVNYTFDPPDGVPRNSGEIDTHRVTIHNARLEIGLGLDRSGFTLIDQRSPLEDWTDYRDPERVKAHYYPAVDAALRARTGAVKVVIFDHTLRDSTAPAGRAEVRDPVRRVHDDQTFDSAPNRVRKHLPPDEAEQRLRGRFAIVNFWRPIGGPIEQAPLALCDARSIAPDDLIPSDLVYRDWTGETYSFAYNPRHRWYWYPEQQPDEVTLLKVFDSATDGTARLTAHTAFDDPNTAFDASPRRSIEVRTLLFW